MAAIPNEGGRREVVIKNTISVQQWTVICPEGNSEIKSRDSPCHAKASIQPGCCDFVANCCSSSHGSNCSMVPWLSSSRRCVRCAAVSSFRARGHQSSQHSSGIMRRLMHVELDMGHEHRLDAPGVAAIQVPGQLELRADPRSRSRQGLFVS